VSGHVVTTRKHCFETRVLDLAKCLAARCDHVRSSDIEINDLAWQQEHAVDLLLVVLPSLLISLQLFVLVLPFLCELLFFLRQV